MIERWIEPLQKELESKQQELEQRLQRIKANLRRPLESDSKERATQLENQEVVDALGNEARVELLEITIALRRIMDGSYGICVDCGEEIARERLRACAHAQRCIDCADEHALVTS